MGNLPLNYYLPQLGRVKVDLYSHAFKCYHLLENYDHIERLKKIDQLGVVRNVYEGAHHPRWEYVILQLHLINRLRNLKKVKGSGLSSKTEFLKYELSGAEILQIWILLLNSGHLPGTFASERALLKTFKESSRARNAFKKGLRSEQKKFLDKIIENEDIYAVHKILMSFHLGRYHRFEEYKVGRTTFAKLLQEVLNFYIFNPKEDNLSDKRYKLKSIFKRVRQISYLFLDSQFTAFPVNFDISKIFLNLEDYYEDIFVLPESQILKTLNSFDDLLSVSLYHSPQSISELGKHAALIQEKLDGENFSRYYDIHKYLLQSNNFKHNHDPNNEYVLQILFDLSMYASFKDNFKVFLNFKNERKWNKTFGANNCLVTFQSSPNMNQIVINLRILERCSMESNVKIFGNLLKQFIGMQLDLKKLVYHKESVEKLFQRPSEELMFEILKKITYPELYFEFKDNFNLESSILSISGSKSAAKQIDNFYKSIYKSNISNSRKNELNAVKETLLQINHPGKLLISLAPILVYNEEREQVTDLDGFAIGFINGKLKIIIIEAKNQKRRSIKACEIHLKETFDKLKFITSETINITELPSYNCVFSYFTVDGKV